MPMGSSQARLGPPLREEKLDGFTYGFDFKRQAESCKARYGAAPLSSEKRQPGG